MKKIILCIIWLNYACIINAQKNNEAYKFPIRPGMEEWKKFTSSQEMVEACTIPDSILRSLTTAALVKTSLSYPLLINVTVASNFQKGIESVAGYFNGLAELFKRKDAGAELFKIYRNKDVQEMAKKSGDVQKGAYMMEFTYLELLLAQPAVLNNLSSKEKMEILKEALLKHDAKKERIDVFGGYGLTTSLFLAAKILQTENKMGEVLKQASQKDIDIFLTTGLYSDASILTTIYSTARSLQ